MFKSYGLLLLLGALPLVSHAGSPSDYTSLNVWRTAMQQAGYQVVGIEQSNADALFVSCVSTCVQYDWGKLENYDNVPRNPREWMQLLPGTPIYGFGAFLQLTDSEQAGLAFASGDPRSGQPVTAISTLNGGDVYSGFFGFATGGPVTDLYIGYPAGVEEAQQTSGETFSMDNIFFAVAPKAASTPEPGSFALFGVGLGAFATIVLRARTGVFRDRFHGPSRD
jgi:hypothetical protein